MGSILHLITNVLVKNSYHDNGTMVTGTMVTVRDWHTKRGEDGMQNGETERLERKTGEVKKINEDFEK